MIHFPRIRRLRVQHYDLYPAANPDRALSIQVPSGPLIILGVNGLGKSTLLLLMRFLITGPWRARDAGFAGERKGDLLPVEKSFFAVRVSDRAQEARAEIEIGIGDDCITIERRLSDLRLIAAHKVGTPEAIYDEESLQGLLATSMGLQRFPDVVALLERVTFVLESRTPLLWNLSAQFEVFRAILTPNLSEQIRQLEGQIISADSSARNLNATIHKISKRQQEERKKAANQSATWADVKAKEGTRDRLLEECQELVDEHEQANDQVYDELLAFKKIERAADNAQREYEKVRFDMLRQSLAGLPISEKYVFLKLMSEHDCIVCGSDAKAAAAELADRQASSKCLVCGSKLQPSLEVENGEVGRISDAKKKIAEDKYNAWQAFLSEKDAAQKNYEQAKSAADQLAIELDQKQVDIGEVEQRLRSLRRKLPSQDRADEARNENRIFLLREEVQEFRNERDRYEEEISLLLSKLTGEIEQVRTKLESRFDELSREFFAEKVRLVYSPRESRIGQQGRFFSFPAFEVEMTSGATLAEFVRREQEQVSLSQRDYLDIVFRMAVLDVFSDDSGTIAVDGPEGAVDAIFAEKAGNLFAKFTAEKNSNAILACNIVEGGFIPHTLKHFDQAEKQDHIVNLLESGATTAALRDLAPNYADKISEILMRDVSH